MIFIENWISATLVSVSTGAALYGYSKVPHENMIAIHFNTEGIADGFAPGHIAFFVIPMIGIAILGMTVWQGGADSAGRTWWSISTVIPLVVQAVLCFGQFIIVARAVRG